MVLLNNKTNMKKTIKKKNAKLSIIIISTNESHYLKKCLDSIFNNLNKKNNFEVILIDNNSSDNTSLLVKKNYPQVILHKRNKTFGFSANNNFAIKKSHGEYILLLNADTICKKESIWKLLKFMETHQSVGVCGPKLIYPDKTLQLSCRKFPTLWSGILRRSPLRIFFPIKMRDSSHLNVYMDHNKSQKVDWLLGACLMINKKTINDVGLLDEKFFLYVDDIDYAWRVWQAGWQVYYLPESVVVHYHQAKSDNKFFSFHSRQHFKSILRFLWKHKYFLKTNFYVSKQTF